MQGWCAYSYENCFESCPISKDEWTIASQIHLKNFLSFFIKINEILTLTSIKLAKVIKFNDREFLAHFSSLDEWIYERFNWMCVNKIRHKLWLMDALGDLVNLNIF